MAKQVRTLCGAALMATLPSGCIPEEARPLTDEQKTIVRNVLEDNTAHLDLLVDIVDRGKDLFAHSDGPVDGEVIRSEWEASITRGHAMLATDSIYVVPFSAAEFDNGHYYGGRAFSTLDDTGEIMLIQEDILKDSGLSATVMHELGHLKDDPLYNHDNSLKYDVSPSIDQIIAYQDFAFRDDFFFTLLEGIRHSGGMQSYFNITSQDNFDDRYDSIIFYKQLIREHPELWAPMYAQYMYNGYTKGVDQENAVTALTYYAENEPYAATVMLRSFGIDESAFGEILQADSAQFIRQQGITYADEAIQELADNHPEYCEVYRERRKTERLNEIRNTRFWR